MIEEVFKCEVSSVKSGRPGGQPSASSYFKLPAERRLPKTYRTKQSQSHRLGDGPEGRDIPPIHYSIIPPFQSDADRGKQSQFTRRCRPQLYKQTQSGVPMHEEACRREQTNPILRDARRGLPPRACAGRLYKQTQFHSVAPGLAVQTNPICPPPDGQAGPWLEPIVPNKPNFAGRRLYKQTQFGVFSNDEECHREQAKPNSGRMGHLGDGAPGSGNRAKQSQTWAPWGIWGTGRGTQGRCAKQTQFPVGTRPQGRGTNA
jgi:hypothetical protein